jgi:hypothetical protein
MQKGFMLGFTSLDVKGSKVNRPANKKKDVRRGAVSEAFGVSLHEFRRYRECMLKASARVLLPEGCA